MKVLFFSFMIFFMLLSCSPKIRHTPATPAHALIYTVNLNDRDDDFFHVRLLPGPLDAENNIYQFAATAPGTYQVMDIGRFVHSFQALDAAGDTIAVKHTGVNQWQITHPELVHEIRYSIAETWDTPVDSNRVYPMCGTSIEKDHVLLNNQAVFGYLKGMQKKPVLIKLIHPAGWQLGTALTKINGYYLANNYDQLVDSPILAGKLSSDSLDVRGAKIKIFTYSQTGMIRSGQILKSIRNILNAAADFTEGLPVDHYTFLFHFEQGRMGGGAWEHSYSSEYTMPEDSLNRLLKMGLASTIAHEFFHIITPLNIHSKIIETFNFVKPVASRHLWLYEGTTEWAARIMQLRAGLTPLNEYLNILSKKLTRAAHYNPDYSLVQLSLNSYSTAGQRQYGNIYAKGALTAGLLDIRLLELSHGTRGLREVIHDLSQKFGPHHAFMDSAFFDIFVDETYPEIRDFINRYIRGSEPLPIAAYYDKIGIAYQPEQKTGIKEATTGLQLSMNRQRELFVQKADSGIQAQGIQAGDIILHFNEQKLKPANLRSIFTTLKNLPADSVFTLGIERNGTEMNFNVHKIIHEKIRKHVFHVLKNPTPQQKKLFDAWRVNLPE